MNEKETAAEIARQQYDSAAAQIVERFGTDRFPIEAREVEDTKELVRLKSIMLSVDGPMVFFICIADGSPLRNYPFVQHVADVCKVFEPISTPEA